VSVSLVGFLATSEACSGQPRVPLCMTIESWNPSVPVQYSTGQALVRTAKSDAGQATAMIADADGLAGLAPCAALEPMVRNVRL
jgi:hypothetical protein